MDRSAPAGRDIKRETVMGARLRATLTAGLIGILCLGSGCFDVENELTLNVGNSGDLKLILRFPASMSEIIKLSRLKGQSSISLAKNIVSPPSKITLSHDKAGSYIVERAQFSNLSEVKSNYPLGKVVYAVTEVVRPGPARKGTYRLSVILTPPARMYIAPKTPSGRKISPEKRRQIVKMIRAMFKHKVCIIRLRLPAPAVKAGTISFRPQLLWDLVAGDLISPEAVVANPVISDDGQSVTWRIPLLKLVGPIGGARRVLITRLWADFRTPYGIHLDQVRSISVPRPLAMAGK
jgi:hypothetical protein